MLAYRSLPKYWFSYEVCSFTPAITLLSTDISRADDMRIATVDVSKIFDNWNFSIKSKEKLQKLEEFIEKENNDRRAVIQRLQMMRGRTSEKFKLNAAAMSAEEKSKMNDEYLSMGLELKTLERDRRDFLEKEKRRVFKEQASVARSILDRINEAIQAYALEKKYQMVIEMGGLSTRSVPLFLHLDGAVDISDEIISRLNEKGSH